MLSDEVLAQVERLQGYEVELAKLRQEWKKALDEKQQATNKETDLFNKISRYEREVEAERTKLFQLMSKSSTEN